jgi:hypothetical protein
MSHGGTHQHAGGPFHPRPSAGPLLLVLVLVGGAIAFGIFGHAIAGRLSLGGGTPLSDVVGFAGSLRDDAMLQCLQSREEGDLHPQEARSIAQQTLRRSVSVPDLSASGFALRQVARVSLPGSGRDRSVCATYRSGGDFDGRWVHLFLAPDDGQYLSFDSVGRPRPLAPDLTIEGDLPGRNPTQPAVALVWSDGPILHVACFDDADDAEEVREAIGAP